MFRCRLCSIHISLQFLDILRVFLDLVIEPLELGFDFSPLCLAVLNGCRQLRRVLLGFRFRHFGLGDLVVGDIDVKSNSVYFGLLRQEFGSTYVENFLLEILDRFFDLSRLFPQFFELLR